MEQCSLFVCFYTFVQCPSSQELTLLVWLPRVPGMSFRSQGNWCTHCLFGFGQAILYFHIPVLCFQIALFYHSLIICSFLPFSLLFPLTAVYCASFLCMVLLVARKQFYLYGSWAYLWSWTPFSVFKKINFGWRVDVTMMRTITEAEWSLPMYGSIFIPFVFTDLFLFNCDLASPLY